LIFKGFFVGKGIRDGQILNSGWLPLTFLALPRRYEAPCPCLPAGPEPSMVQGRQASRQDGTGTAVLPGNALGTTRGVVA